MRRILSISGILALIISVGSPALLSAYAGRNVPMACHRSALPEAAEGMTHAHCHDMADMPGMEADSMPPESGDDAIAGSADAKCPMGCCTMASSANQAAPASPLILAAPLLVEHRISVSKSVFSRNGFSSHTDRGPPLA
ncbi:MAG: hypothetical protein LAP21_05330 [Acidobacteriia bacterium]|nr:hypothetical protein [Terriglobia bacterium]